MNESRKDIIWSIIANNNEFKSTMHTNNFDYFESSLTDFARNNKRGSSLLRIQVKRREAEELGKAYITILHQMVVFRSLIFPC